MNKEFRHNGDKEMKINGKGSRREGMEERGRPRSDVMDNKEAATHKDRKSKDKPEDGQKKKKYAINFWKHPICKEFSKRNISY